MTFAISTPIHRPAKHESGFGHVTGDALYVDDFPQPEGVLVAQAIVSPHARARILRRDVGRAMDVPGVAAVLFADDIPGHNDASAFAGDEPLLAESEVYCVGQYVAVVVADTYAACRQGAALVEIEYEPLPAVLNVLQAVEEGMFIGEPQVIARGDVEAALAGAALRLDGEVHSGGQDHFYLETHAAQAVSEENGAWRILSSTQHPTEVQAKVAELMGIGRHQVVVECPRMGGGFGGKETQGAHIAQMAALAAHHTGRPVRIRLNRDQDMNSTGKRHGWYSRYEAGFDGDGSLLALRVYTYADGGWSSDLSPAILQRCLFHLDNAYSIPVLHFEGRIARTNIASNTAFRGFGGPQGMLVIERILNRVAEKLKVDPADIRKRNMYRAAPHNVTPFGQTIELKDNRLPSIWDELIDSSEYRTRREAIERFNERSHFTRRGIGFQPVKFGISFTNSMLNQAGALVHVYADGTVQLNHGGTEMGQGLHTKMLAVCGDALGVSLEKIRMMTTATDKVPNTSATAASAGSDLNGQAVSQACSTIRERMRPVAAGLLGVEAGASGDIVFADGRVFVPGQSQPQVSFAEVAQAAYLAQVSLSSTGYYRTPNLYFDAAKGQGNPFHYFAFGAAVVEVEINGLTGEYRMQRVDILHDVGNSLVPTIDRGQIEGGFIQGVGWLTVEELVFDDSGRLLTHGPSTYKIPAVGDAPEHFRVRLLEGAGQEGVIHRSKAVGEPPLMLGIGMVTALRHAIGSFGKPGSEVTLSIPCTAEAVLRAVEGVRSGGGA